MLENWLKPMLHNHVDTIVLGCTHYPLVKNNQRYYGTRCFAYRYRRCNSKRLMILSQNAGHINEGELDILVLYTGTINTSMVKWYWKKKIWIKEMWDMSSIQDRVLALKYRPKDLRI